MIGLFWFELLRSHPHKASCFLSLSIKPPHSQSGSDVNRSRLLLSRSTCPVSEDGGVDEAEREALLRIARGAVITAGGVSGQRILTTTAEVILARGLGPTAYGVYAFAWRITQLFVALVPFGSVPALQRYVPAGSGTQRQAVVALAYATTLLVGLVMAVSVWITAPWLNTQTVQEPTFPPTMRLFGLLIGALGVIAIAAATFRAIGSARGEVVFNKVLRPAVRLLAVVGALTAGFTVVGVVATIVAATAVLAVVAVIVAVRTTGIVPAAGQLHSEWRRFYNHAVPVAMSSLGKLFQNRIDVLLVGALLSAVPAGIYNAVLVLIAIAWIPLLSFNQLLPPVASDLYASGDIATLNAVYTSVTRLIVTTVVPILVVLGVYGDQLLAVFGPTYVDGYVPLLVYLFGVFVGSAVGATGWLLMMTDHQYARMVLDWLLAVLNVILTYAFIVQFELVGAALGTALAIAIQNGLQVLLLRHFEGLWPFDRTFLKPLLAGAVAAGGMLLVAGTVGGVQAVGLGTAVGIALYGWLLLRLGLPPQERLLLAVVSNAVSTRFTR